jgi:hypothetical protein
MLRLAKLGLAIVIVVSLASILITPDPSDDVDGVLQRHHLVKVAVAPISARQRESPAQVSGELSLLVFPRSTPSNLLDLVCVRLC